MRTTRGTLALVTGVLIGVAGLVGYTAYDARQARAEAPLSLPAAGGKVSGTLHAFDATTAEVSCQAKGGGRAAGTGEGSYDQASHTLSFTLSVQGGAPNQTYLVDVSECATGGERLARGDAGHFTTDAAGNGTISGTYVVQSDARWIKAAVLSYCADPAGGPPVLPCTAEGFATDALLPPGR